MMDHDTENVDKMLRGIYSALLRHKMLFAIYLCLPVVVTFAYLSMQPRLYEATAVVALEAQNANFISANDVSEQYRMEDAELLTAMERLRSATLISKVLSEHSASWGFLFNGVVSDPIEFRGSEGPKGDEGRSDVSHDMLLQASKNVLDYITIRQRGRSRAIEISVMHPHPSVARLTANALAEEFVMGDIQSTTDMNGRVISASRRIETLLTQNEKQAKDQLEKKVSDSRGDGSLLASQIYSEKLAEQRKTLQQLRLERSSRNSKLLVVTEAFERAGASKALVLLGSDQTSDRLIEQLSEAEAQFIAAKQTYGPQHHKYLEANEEYQSQLSRAAEAVRGFISQLKTEISAHTKEIERIENEIASTEVELRDAEYNRQEIAQLEQDLKHRQDAIREYQSQLNEAEKLGLTVPRSRASVLSSAATPKSSVYPKTGVLMALSLVGGLVLAFGAVGVVEIYSDRMHPVDEIIQRFNLQGGAVLPDLGRSKPVLPGLVLPKFVGGRNPKKSHLKYGFIQALSLVSAQIQQGNAMQNQASTFLVTSSLPDEGKSTITMHLAKSLTRQGLRVLVIDGDVRRPSLHKLMQMGDPLYLSDFDPQRESYKKVLHQHRRSNASFIFSAPARDEQDCQKLLKLVALVAVQAAADFDVILIDTSPIMATSDVVVLSGLLKSLRTIFIADWKTSKYAALEKSVKLLEMSQVPASFVIINKVQFSDYWLYADYEAVSSYAKYGAHYVKSLGYQYA